MTETITTKRGVQVGDIFEHSYGYNCTRTEFVKIVALNKSGKTATIVRLGTKQVSGDWMNGLITCNEQELERNDREDGKPMTLKVKDGGWDTEVGQYLRGSTRGGGYLNNFYHWNGKPVWNNCD